MSNLNFKWGNHAGLPKSLAAQDVGALFFTKDEGALYLGVESGKAPRRIQGTVQYYASLDAFKAEVLPPYSADVIYYIASENALVKWKEKKAASGATAAESGEFVVLNVTASEFATQVAALSGDIAGNTGSINALKAKVGESNAEAGTGSAFARIKSLEEAVDALEELTGTGGSGTSLADRIKALEDWQKTINTWKTDISKTVSDHTSEIGTNTSNISKNAAAIKTNADDIDALEGRMTAAESDITTAKGNITTLQTDLDAAEKTIGEHTTKLSEHTGSIGDLTTAINTIEKTTIPGLDGRITQNANGLSTLKGRVDGHDTNISDLTERMDDVEDVADGAAKQANTNKSDIATLTTKAEGLRTDLGNTGDAASATGSAFARIAQVKSDLSTLDTKVTGANGLTAKVSTLEGEMDTAQSDISGLKTTTAQQTKDIASNASNITANATAIAKKADKTALEALEDRVDTNATNIGTNTAGISAINTKIGDSDDTKNDKTVYGAIAKVAADLADESSARSTLAGRVSTAEGKITTAESDIDGLQTRMTNVESKNTTQDTAIAKAQADATAAGNAASKNAGDIADLDTNLSSNYYTKTDINNKIGTKPDHITATNIYAAIDEVYNDINSELTNHIRAANALVYKNGVTAESWANVKDAAAEIGWVYVVTESTGTFDVNGTNQTCYAGDMLIATGTETNGVLSDPTWVLVRSGYNKELQGTLSLTDADGASSAAKVQVALTSLNGAGTTGDLGKFTIESGSKNLEITTVTGGMKLQMVWDTF